MHEISLMDIFRKEKIVLFWKFVGRFLKIMRCLTADRKEQQLSKWLIQKNVVDHRKVGEKEDTRSSSRNLPFSWLACIGG